MSLIKDKQIGGVVLLSHPRRLLADFCSSLVLIEQKFGFPKTLRLNVSKHVSLCLSKPVLDKKSDKCN